jgi:glucose/arabinose dehydrogenase
VAGQIDGFRRIRPSIVTTPLRGFAVLTALAACQGPVADPDQQVGTNPALPPVRNYLVPPMRVPTPVGWGKNVPTVPQGLQVQALASGLKNPRSVLPLPNGDVLVVESGGPKAPINRPKDLIMGWVKSFSSNGTKPGNRVVLLRDADGDGVAEVRSVFIDKLNSPFGLALVGDSLYVANTDAIVRYPYFAGQIRIAVPGEKLTDLPAGPINHHWTKSLVASPDGSKLYVGIGSNSNIAENGMDAERDRAAIWEIDRTTGAHRVFASGLRNPNGLTFHPQTQRLWSVINERDEIGPDLVPDYLTSVRADGFYGWPYSYYGQHIDVRVQPQRPDLVARAIAPDYALGSHVAPLGLAFNQGDGLPAAYAGGAFVGEHGSWNRKPVSGYKVVFVPFANGKPIGKAQDFVTGFLTADGHTRGRPVAVAFDRAGALLIADDVGNTIWRVSGKAQPAQTAMAGSKR